MEGEWREPVNWALGLYTLLAVLFWTLALGPGSGGTSEVEVGWQGAAITLMLLIPLWLRHVWAVTLLALLALLLTVGIASNGLPPEGPTFGGLAFLSGVQFILLCVLGFAWRDRS